MLLKFFLQFILDAGSFGFFTDPCLPIRLRSSAPSSGRYPVRGLQPTRWQSSPWRAAFGEIFFFLILLAKLSPPLYSICSLIANVASFLHINSNFLRQIKENIQPNEDMEISFYIDFDSKVLLSKNTGFFV